MNTLIQTVHHDIKSVVRLPAGTKRLLQTVALAAVLVSGFAAASVLAILQTGLGVAESGRVIAAFAGSLGWLYLGLAIDEERFSDALPDIVSFALIMTFAVLSLAGNTAFIAAAFAVHLVRAILRLSKGTDSVTASYGLLAWIGFTFGSALVSIAAIA